MAVCGFLAATFALTLLKAVGRTSDWTALLDAPPNVAVTAGPRIAAFGIMAGSFVGISEENWPWFLAASVAFGAAGFLLVYVFDVKRRCHLHDVPLLARGGGQLHDADGRPKSKVIVIGTEDAMNPLARQHFNDARARHGAISLVDFLSGYSQPYDPEALWDRAVLARIGSTLVLLLMGIFFCGVLALYLAALVVEVNL